MTILDTMQHYLAIESSDDHQARVNATAIAGDGQLSYSFAARAGFIRPRMPFLGRAPDV